MTQGYQQHPSLLRGSREWVHVNVRNSIYTQETALAAAGITSFWHLDKGFHVSLHTFTYLLHLAGSPELLCKQIKRRMFNFSEF